MSELILREVKLFQLRTSFSKGHSLFCTKTMCTWFGITTDEIMATR